MSESLLQFPDISQPTSPGPDSGENMFNVCSPEVAKVKQSIRVVKGSVGTLTASIDIIGNQAAQIMLLGGGLETAQELNNLVKEMEAQEKKQQEDIQNILALAEDVLKGQMEDHLKMRIEKEINAQIDEEVKSQVAAQLQTIIPKKLQDEVASTKRQLQKAQRDLSNSESRRSNAKLRFPDNNRLQAILMSNGEASEAYPKDLQSLFGLDANKCKQLMSDYEMEDASDSKEKNLNRFIEFCGVSYQLMSNTGGKPRPFRKLSSKDDFVM